MKFTAQQIATVVQGEIEGNPERVVWNLAKIEEAGEGDLCFLANPKYEEHVYSTGASVVLVNKNLQLRNEVKTTLIRVPDAYAAFALLLQTYQDITAGPAREGIEQPSFVSPNARIGERVYIGAFAYIADGAELADGVKVYPGTYVGERVQIGRDTLLHAGVRVYAGCRIGERCIVHAGAVIGSDGFGFAPENGRFRKIPQIGHVVLEDDVEVGANTTIDRATMGATVIHAGSKLDNLVQIAHNVEVGSHTVIAAQAGISGSTRIGQYCQIGGQAGVVGHIRMADFTRINAQSGVSKEITQPNTALTGSPAYDYRSTLKSQAIFRRLPDMQQRIDELERRLNDLMNRTTS